MLQNAYFVAKIGADTAENEQHSAEILPTCAGAGDWQASLEVGSRQAGKGNEPVSQGEKRARSTQQTCRGSFSALAKPIFASGV